MQANEITPALPFRQHTIFGVCEGIGEDFGFNPTFIRIPLAVAVLWSPTVAIGIYFALGLVVLASRLLFPNRGDATAPVEQQPAAPHVANQEVQPQLPLAA